MFKKFSKIGQFRDVIRTVRSQHDYKGKDEAGAAIYSHDSPYPVLKFEGTVKLHGTNAAIGFDENGEIWTQSRNRMLTTVKHSTNDNQGFAHFVACRSSIIKKQFCGSHGIIIYGEWCGGSIQSSVALNQLPNMFVIFAVKNITPEEWVTKNYLRIISDDELQVLNDNNIYLISQFPSYEIEVDFNNPELVQNELAELTKQVGDCCPVAKQLGVEGTGEGIVWKCVNPNPEYDNSGYWFKVKDERHQKSKVKTLAPVDIEKVKSVEEFVNNTVTTGRLEQGIEYLNEMKIPIEIKSTGHFIKWVQNDIVEEEGDTMVENGLNRRDVCPAIGRRAKEFWMNKINDLV